MGEEFSDRNAFIARVGTYFILVGLFAIIIFVASDATRTNDSRWPQVTQTYIVQAIQAIQTRDADATLAFARNLPSPTLQPAPITAETDTGTYIPFFCLGTFGLVAGWLLWRSVAEPPKPSNRFGAIRSFMQKQRENAAKRAAAKKEKEAAKKQKPNN